MDTLIQILISVLIFSTVSLLIWALFRFPVAPEPPVNRQIALAMGLGSRATVFEAPVLGQLLGFAMLMARRFPFFRKKIRADLEASGNPSGYTVDEYIALSIGCAVVVEVVAIAMIGQLGQFIFLWCIIMPVMGFAGPLYTLHSQARTRVRLISKKLPYTLDLVALMMESGAMFTESIETIIQDEPDDELNRELSLVQSEIEFGTTRAVALANMAERIPLETLRSVVGAINQAEALGTPLSTILKNQSGMIRMMRTVKAEEASASASMKILIPGTLILIAVVLLFFGPIIMRMYHGNLISSP